MSTDKYIIGKVIKYFRNKRGISQEALAKDICNKDHLYTIERGTHDPSPALLEQLSLRLGINLFDYRYFVSLHGSFECHEKCTNLSSLVSDENIAELDKYIDKYENDPDFSSGEPLLLLLYCKARSSFNKRHYSETLNYCLNAMQILNIHPNDDLKYIENLNDTSLCIIRLYAITLHTLERYNEALTLYLALYNQYHFILERPNYEINKSLHLQAVTFIVVSYNLAVLYNDEHNYKKSEPLIIDALNLLQKMKSVHMMIPLLECYIDVCYNTNRLEKAQEIFDDIPIILKYCGEEHFFKDFLTTYEQYLPLLKLNK